MLPPYRVAQTAAKEFARNKFASAFHHYPRLFERLLRMYDDSGVEYRDFCAPEGRFFFGRTTRPRSTP